MVDTIFGTKYKLTQAWDKAGFRLPITIIKADPMTVTQIKHKQTDGYQAIQIGFAFKKWTRINKPLTGHLKKSFPQSKSGAKKATNLAPSFLREIRVKSIDEFKLKDTIVPSDVLASGDLVNVTGISKGRGFAGVIKRYGFKGGPRSHGQSDRERAPGSIGQGTDPGRVHKGKKMPGHYGAAKTTLRNLTVVKVDDQAGEVWLKGQVPGAINTPLKLKLVGQNKKFPGLLDSKKPLPPDKQPLKKPKSSQKEK